MPISSDLPIVPADENRESIDVGFPKENTDKRKYVILNHKIHYDKYVVAKDNRTFWVKIANDKVLTIQVVAGNSKFRR
ncbi:MAG: hypothetical protein ACLVIY_02100 [Anaerobutyricum soehngenii]